MKRVKIVYLMRVAMVLLAPLATGHATASPYEDAFTGRLANPDDTATLNQFINIAIESGQYDQALSTLEQHLIAYPRDAQARLVAGRLYNHVGSYDLALRQVKYAISIGSLDTREIAEAEKLRQRIEKGLSGNYGSISFTAGGEIIHTDFATTAAIADRTDFNPYGRIAGTYRFGIESPTDDAIIISADARITRQFGDFDLSGDGGIFSAASGRASLTWEKGLPSPAITSLRMGLSIYTDYRSFEKSAVIREYGIQAKFTAQPSADATVYASFGAADLSTSDLLFTDYRIRAEVGGARRISSKHALGAAVRGQFDYTNDGIFVGSSVEATGSYSGLLWAPPKGPVWSHRVSLGGGAIQLPDLSLAPGDRFDGDFWTARWDHVFEINEQNKFNIDAFYRQFNFDDRSRDQSVYGIGLSYTYTIR